eukprot:398082_1
MNRKKRKQQQTMNPIKEEQPGTVEYEQEEEKATLYDKETPKDPPNVNINDDDGSYYSPSRAWYGLTSMFGGYNEESDLSSDDDDSYNNEKEQKRDDYDNDRNEPVCDNNMESPSPKQMIKHNRSLSVQNNSISIKADKINKNR